jgi:hypothetical protein
MKFQDAFNNVECRFLNDTERQLLHKAEWELIKAEIKMTDKCKCNGNCQQTGKSKSDDCCKSKKSK